jgi:predicted transcriptional regulator
MALKDTWQANRQQRQQKTMQRRQKVQEFLEAAREARVYQAAELHDELALSRQQRSQQNLIRQAEFQPSRVSLEQFRTALQADMQMFLQETSDRRHVISQDIHQRLQHFHRDLKAATQQQRRSTQMNLATLKIATQDQLEDYYHQRTQQRAETRQQLAAFIENLRVDMQQYLRVLEMQRQESAADLREELQQSRAAITDDVQTMFREFAEFRTELQAFHLSLSESVWGQSGTVVSICDRLTEAESAKDASSAKRIQTLAPSAPAPSLEVGKVSLSFAKNKLKGIARPSAAPLSTISATRATASAASSISAPTKSSSNIVTQPITAHEKDVYQLLHDRQGARLTEIESALKINRFQAVDALRSLIKKGLIRQRDRMYLLQDTVVTV